MTSRVAWAVLVGAMGALVALSPASAAPASEVVEGRYVRLVSVADWDLAAAMSPGEPLRWDVEVSADAPDPGTLTIGVSARGELALVVSAAVCLTPWQGSECAGGADHVRTGWEVPRGGEAVEIASVDADQTAYVRLELEPAEGSTGTTEVRVHASGAGESIATAPGEPLVATASPAAPWLAYAGVVLAGSGAAAIAARTRRSGGAPS
ncbi:hypothetical protein [Microbacterium indicum]|uniref:hypothetical protein n=1 Tax=Microbacterium indicum TaxID=358100 RepID=UPI0012EC0743|nr:hypothetical protein [Microbacterium indicum]